MTDSVLVFPPGFRVLDANGAPVNGAKIKFFQPGPGAAKNVFGDAALTNNLGAIVYTRSDGFPVVSQGSQTTTLIYTGSTAYYIVITDASDVAIFPAKDNVKGAVDTSTFLTIGSTSTLSIPQVSTPVNLTLVAGHKGKLIAASAALTLTLTAAATLLDGWNAYLRNDSASAYVSVSSSDTIRTLMGSCSAFALGPGASCQVVCNGAGFEIVGQTPNFILGTGVLTVVDRVASVPGSPATGARYIATAVFAATPVTTAIGDIIEATGQGTWFKITPPTDCGWTAYVQSEKTLYEYQNSAWVCLTASTAIAQAGTDNAAFMTALAVRNALPARAYAEYTATTSIGAPLMVADDSIPQSGEGTQILSAAITLKSVNSRVRVRFKAFGVIATGGQTTIAALFQDAIANALAVDALQHSQSGAADSVAHPHPLSIEFEHVPGVLSPTYKINVGPTANTMALNSSAVGTRLFGGASRATLVVEELLT